ncbi:MAG: hypothetical protein IJ783_03850 [Kiritimatiellae bacterium]|nr:hypothetical protein [Kiritimatiellia bacterium]
MQLRRSVLSSAALAALLGSPVSNAVSIAPGGSYSQDFDSIGAAASATLPADWKVSNSATARTVGSYAAAGDATTRSGTGTDTANGIYNFGDASDTTDRSVGFLASGSATKTGNLFLKLDNSSSGTITSFSVSYNVELHRNNSNQFRFQLYSSTDGSNWTAVDSAVTSFATGSAGVAAESVSVGPIELDVETAPGGSFYLCWSYSVPSGSTTSNAQGLGIDDVVIAAQGEPGGDGPGGDDPGGDDPVDPPDAPASVAATAAGTSVDVSWDGVDGADEYDVTLYAAAEFSLDFEDLDLVSSTTFQTLSGSASAGLDSVAWKSTANGARCCSSDNHVKGKSLTIRNGNAYPFTFGPFERGATSFSFSYMQAGTSSGNFYVYEVAADGSETMLFGSANGGTDAKPSATAASLSADGLDRTGPVSFKIVGTSQNLAVDDIVVGSWTTVARTTVSAASATFENLAAGTAHFAVVTAKSGAVVSEEARSAVATTAGNRAPELSASSASAAVHAGETASVTLAGRDPDGDELALSVSPAGIGTLSETETAGEWTFSWSPSAPGSKAFTFTLSDGTDTAVAEWTVEAALATPSGLVFSGVSATGATLSWTSVPGAEKYVVNATGLSVKGADVLVESFDGFAGLSKSGSADSAPDTYTTAAGWTLAKAYRGDNGSSSEPGEEAASAKMGTGNAAGSLTTPALDLSARGGAFAVVFRARRWSGDAATITVSAAGASQDVALGDEMQTHAVQFAGGTAATAVTIAAAQNSNNRFFLDDVRVVSGTASKYAIAEGVETAAAAYSASGLVPGSVCEFAVSAVAGEEETSASASLVVPGRTAVLTIW